MNTSPANLIGLLIYTVLAITFSGTGPFYILTPNVNISGSQPSLRHYEAYVRADPKHSNRLISCAYVVRPNQQIENTFYESIDGGKRWSLRLTVPHAVDPSCAINRKGLAFAASIQDESLENGNTRSVISLSRSQDGQEWQASVLPRENRDLDRAYVTVDDTDSRFGGHVYLHAYYFSKTPPAAVVFYVSSDEGRSFNAPLTKEASMFVKPWFFPGNGVVGNDGTFFALVAELDDTKRNMSNGTDQGSAPASANGALNIFRSNDGGRTIGRIGSIPGVYYDWRVPNLSLPALAIDRTHGPFSGRLYAVWPDARYDRRTQILLSYSSDRGQTWSAPQIISGPDDLAVNKHPNNFMPTVAVNRAGVVGVSWYDRRDSADNIGYWVRFSASLDGGVTWLPSTRVSTLPNVNSEDPRKNSGDTAGLSADSDGLFHPVWIDNRTGIPQMWTTTIKVRSP